MNLSEAEDLAARTLDAIDWYLVQVPAAWRDFLAADRERIESDLAGLRQHGMNPTSKDCYWCYEQRGPWPCPDARRYEANLRRTAALYGVAS